MIHRSDVVAFGGTVRKIGCAPRLVERDPRDDARMADVAFDDVQPFLGQTLDRLPGETVGTRHLLPDQEAGTVGPVQIAWILDLLVLADAVEPHGFRQFDVALQCMVIRRRDPAPLPIALIEHEPQRERTAVQQKAIALRGHRPDGGVARGLVEELATISPQLKGDRDQRRRRGRPQELVARVVDPRVGKRDSSRDFRRGQAVRIIADHLFAQMHFDAEAKAVAPVPGDVRLEADVPPLQARAPANRGNPRRWDPFEPDRLPDPCRPWIPDGMGLQLPILLAARLGEVCRVVFGPDDDLACAATRQERRHVDDERRVTPVVGARRRASIQTVAE